MYVRGKSQKMTARIESVKQERANKCKQEKTVVYVPTQIMSFRKNKGEIEIEEKWHR